ncbi:hypothetical protein WR25_18097 [Diploscapter pachys]|uniref:Uncharacterized protein n=1 Tax=Diploscapter pachys TaxID=2018661 RepID=A0A2A2JXL3_9BILA|nr:hypothetical protein WR25_18097 [Diploscapter pachys]
MVCNWQAAAGVCLGARRRRTCSNRTPPTYVPTEVVDRRRITPLGEERLLEARRFIYQRQACGGPYHSAAVQRQHHQATARVGVGSQVISLMLQRPLIEVGILAQHRQAQACKLIDVRRNRRAMQQAYFHGEAVVWSRWITRSGKPA